MALEIVSLTPLSCNEKLFDVQRPGLSFAGIIPARGGSKGVHRKNLREIAGKPLIAYTIEAARRSKQLTSLVTTTDSVEIAEVAAEFGSGILMRPPELAEDRTPMAPVVLHALDDLERTRGEVFDGFILLQPTCPLRTAEDIDRAIKRLLVGDVPGVVSVYQVQDAHPGRMYVLDCGLLKPYDARFEVGNRQELPPVYHRNGAIYARWVKDFRESPVFVPPGCAPLEMSRAASVNIDEELDLLLADLLLRRR